MFPHIPLYTAEHPEFHPSSFCYLKLSPLGQSHYPPRPGYETPEAYTAEQAPTPTSKYSAVFQRASLLHYSQSPPPPRQSQPGGSTAWTGDQSNNRQNPLRVWGELPLLLTIPRGDLPSLGL